MRLIHQRRETVDRRLRIEQVVSAWKPSTVTSVTCGPCVSMKICSSSPGTISGCSCRLAHRHRVAGHVFRRHQQPPQTILRQADDLVQVERRRDLPIAIRIGVVSVVGQRHRLTQERIGVQIDDAVAGCDRETRGRSMLASARPHSVGVVSLVMRSANVAGIVITPVSLDAVSPSVWLARIRQAERHRRVDRVDRDRQQEVVADVAGPILDFELQIVHAVRPAPRATVIAGLTGVNNGKTAWQSTATAP